MEGVMEGKGAGEAEVMEARVGREGVMACEAEGAMACEAEGGAEVACEVEAAGAPTKGAPASVESGSKPSRFRRAPKRQTNLFVK